MMMPGVRNVRLAFFWASRKIKCTTGFVPTLHKTNQRERFVQRWGKSFLKVVYFIFAPLYVVCRKKIGDASKGTP
jgi:hypothetical protein